VPRSFYTRPAAITGDFVLGVANVLAAPAHPPPDSGTLVGELSKLYGDLRALAGSKDYAYVAQLEQSEDRFLSAFEDARKDERVSPSAIATLNRLAPEVRHCHELMRTRKQAMKKAA
jgi:uncharacterized protein (TIGR02284 family)